MFRFSSAGASWAAIAQHPWLVKLTLGLMVLFVLWVGLHRRTREREAREAFAVDCARRGTSDDECEEMLDENATRCFSMSYSPGTRTGETERLDAPRYFECVRVGPDAWSAQRRADLRAQEKQRRENLGL